MVTNQKAKPHLNLSEIPVHLSTPYYEEDDIEEKEKDRNARN